MSPVISLPRSVMVAKEIDMTGAKKVAGEWSQDDFRTGEVSDTPKAAAAKLWVANSGLGRRSRSRWGQLIGPISVRRQRSFAGVD